MKKKMVGIVMASLVLGLAGCGSSGNDSSVQQETGESSVAESSSAGTASVTEGSDEQETTEAIDIAADKKDDYGDVTFRIVCIGDEDWNAQMTEIVENFEKQYPNLKADIATCSDERYTFELATNSYDICMIDSSHLRYAVEMEPLDSYIASGRIDLSDVDDSLVIAGMTDGEVHAISTGVSVPCVYYDAAVLEELKLSLELTPVWSEFGSVVAEVKEKTGKYAYIGNDIDSFKMYLYSIGKNMYGEDGYGFAPEDLAAYVRYLNDLYSGGALYRSEGGIVFWLRKAWISSLSTIEERMGASFTLAFPPVADNAVGSGVYLNPVTLWGICPESENKDLAADFINYLVNDSYAYDVWGLSAGIPASAAMREHLTASVNESDVRLLEYVSELADRNAAAYVENDEDMFKSMFEGKLQEFGAMAGGMSDDGLLEKAKEAMEACKMSLQGR